MSNVYTFGLFIWLAKHTKFWKTHSKKTRKREYLKMVSDLYNISIFKSIAFRTFTSNRKKNEKNEYFETFLHLANSTHIQEYILLAKLHWSLFPIFYVATIKYIDQWCLANTTRSTSKNWCLCWNGNVFRMEQSSSGISYLIPFMENSHDSKVQVRRVIDCEPKLMSLRV